VVPSQCCDEAIEPGAVVRCAEQMKEQVMVLETWSEEALVRLKAQVWEEGRS
jgi:hypothetical protein